MTSHLVWCANCKEEYSGVSVLGAYAFIGQHVHPFMVVLADYEADVLAVLWEAAQTVAA